MPMDLEEDFDEELDHSWLEFHSFIEVEDNAHVEQDISEFIANLAR